MLPIIATNLKLQRLYTEFRDLLDIMDDGKGWRQRQSLFNLYACYLPAVFSLVPLKCPTAMLFAHQVWYDWISRLQYFLEWAVAFLYVFKPCLYDDWIILFHMENLSGWCVIGVRFNDWELGADWVYICSWLMTTPLLVHRILLK